MSIVVSMLKFNLQWHSAAMKKKLTRYKLSILSLILLICPTFTSLVNLVAMLAKSVFSYPINSVVGFCGSLLLFQFLSIVWIFIQYYIVTDQPWKKYLITLPLSHDHNKYADILLIFYIDILIFLPIAVACMVLMASSSSICSGLLIFEKCIVFISMILLMQITVIKAKFYMCIPVLIIDFCIIYCSIFLQELSQSVIMSLLIICIFFLINDCYRGSIPKFRVKELRLFYCTKKNIHSQSSILGIILKSMTQQISQLSVVCVAMLFISSIALLFLIYCSRNHFLPFLLSLLILVNSLCVSNVYKHIHQLWQDYSRYFHSLPMGKFFLYKNCLFIALALNSLFNLIILILAASFFGIAFASKISVAFVLSLIFLSTSYIPQIKFSEYGLLVTFLLMSGFAYIDYLII